MNDLFQETQTPVEPQSYLPELVGDNRKFKDVESLARGKWQSDNYIKTLERQLDEYRTDMLKLQEDANKRATLEDLINQVRQPQSRDEPEVRVETREVRPDPKEIEQLIDTRMSQREQARKREDNFKYALGEVKKQFGEDYQAKLYNRIQNLDITVEEANILASNNPKAFIRMIEEKTDFQPDMFGAPRSQTTFKPNPPEKRTWSWYQKLKQANPAEYRSAKTNVQMHNDMMSLGEEFMDGDYFTSHHPKTSTVVEPSVARYSDHITR